MWRESSEGIESSSFGKRPILAFAHHPWREPQWMNRQQLLSRLHNRGWPVYYSTGALDLWERGQQAWSESGWFMRHEALSDVNLSHAARLLPRWEKSPLVSRWAVKHHCRSVTKYIMKTHHQEPILWSFHPVFWPYITDYPSATVIFHAYDLFSGQPGWNDQKAHWQEQLLARADLVTASSEYIASELATQSGRDVKVLPNGADVRAFVNGKYLPCPMDLACISHPRIGYSGAVNKKVDLKLVAELAGMKPEWNWCFVGPVAEAELLSDPRLSDGFSACKKAPNVHFLGSRNFTDVPAYVAHMDVNVMCYRTDGDGWWKAIYPLKMHEYFATGNPVVSSPLHAVLAFEGCLRLADSTEDWRRQIQCALHENDPLIVEKRISTAWSHGWESQVTILERWIGEIA